MGIVSNSFPQTSLVFFSLELFFVVLVFINNPKLWRRNWNGFYACFVVDTAMLFEWEWKSRQLERCNSRSPGGCVCVSREIDTGQWEELWSRESTMATWFRQLIELSELTFPLYVWWGYKYLPSKNHCKDLMK